MADKLIDNGTLLALGLVGLVAAAGAMKRGSGNVDEYLARKMLLKSIGKRRILRTTMLKYGAANPTLLHAGDIVVPINTMSSGGVTAIVWEREGDGARGYASDDRFGDFSREDAERI